MKTPFGNVKFGFGGSPSKIAETVTGKSVDSLMQQQANPYDESRKAYIDALENQKKKMTDISDKFRKEAPGIQAKGEGAIGDEERISAKEGIQDIRKGASKRGLLYSGLRQGAEAGRIGESQSRIAGRSAELSSQIETQKELFDNLAVQANLNRQAGEAGLAGQDYSSSLQSALERRKQLAGIGKGLGSVAGMALGGGFGGGGSSPTPSGTTDMGAFGSGRR